jgi:hypothetical protein
MVSINIVNEITSLNYRVIALLSLTTHGIRIKMGHFLDHERYPNSKTQWHRISLTKYHEIKKIEKLKYVHTT